ncbi:MAG: MFS transporter [Synechococcales bacterium]|nr:MFS transporter [Synechococcales bacterium]
MSAIANLPKSSQRDLSSLFASGLLFWACMASMLPVLPLYIKDGGASDHEVGLVMGSFAIGLLLFRPQMGKLADARGRKLVMLIGILVAATAPIAYALTPTKGWLMGIRAFHGLSIAAYTTAFSALVADIAPRANRGEVIGYMTLVNPIGMALGPMVGAWTLRSFNYETCYWVSSLLASISFVIASRIRPQPSPITAQTQGLQNPIPSQAIPGWQLILSDRLRIPTFTLLMVGLAFGILSSFVPLYLRASGLPIDAGSFYTSAAITSFMMRFVLGKASDRLGRGRFITLGLICYALSMLLLCLTQDIYLFILSGLLEGMGGGTVLPIMLALVTDRSRPEERGRIFSLCISGFDLGIFLAGPLLGGIADRIGYQGLFGVATGMVVLSILVFLTRSSKDLAHSLRFSLSQGRDLYAVSE